MSSQWERLHSNFCSTLQATDVSSPVLDHHSKSATSEKGYEPIPKKSLNNSSEYPERETLGSLPGNHETTTHERGAPVSQNSDASSLVVTSANQATTEKSPGLWQAMKPTKCRPVAAANSPQGAAQSTVREIPSLRLQTTESKLKYKTHSSLFR
ncbi:hypothetical protein M501DRAFT_1017986 [Patellaria atrata CBS 101060]|uniref:Uncharacterized protein n=1 Tax=Patellaria atrata CBS 101060 TaxID=1346257 RepID=A0A9P4S7T0_9PEZI|nr:hypothetical protein M501DRAFT_1017986 [Patellaria atrata CBS 101060]